MASKVTKRKRAVAEEIDFTQIAANIEEVGVSQFVNENYLNYAYYVIQDRALISADGLKPVQRRILQTMFSDNILHNSPHMKAATVAGNTMGRLHPHGNVSIEDALGRMAQKHVMRVPLIDYYGSIGEEAGDALTAARYWEARLSRPAVELIKELKSGAVPTHKNFDGTLDEVSVLPSTWPVGLVNGSEGIAVGYASTMPPHNPTEVMDAAIALIQNPKLTLDELMEIMPGPDFPTWGQVTGVEGVRDYYETGRGTFSIRGEHEVEQLPRGRARIEFFSLPYQVSPEKILTDLKKAQQRGLLKEISEAKNLGSGDETRVSFTVKAGSNLTQVLQSLYKYTSVEVKFSSNMTVLDDNVPKLMSMHELLQQFIDFRQIITVNKLEFRLEHIKAIVERLEGIIKVIDVDLDKAIAIIRKSDTAEIAQTKLMKTFKINEEQSSYILSMTLRRLTKSDTTKIRNDIRDYTNESKEITKVLGSEKELFKVIVRDMEEIATIIGDERRTEILNKTAEDIAQENKAIRTEIKTQEKDSPCYITVFANGLISKQAEPYKQTRKVIPILNEFKSTTQADLIVLMKDGTGHKVPATYIAPGDPVSISMLGVDENEVIGVTNQELGKDGFGTLVITSKGEVNIINGGYPVSMSTFEAVKLPEGVELVLAQFITKEEQESNDIVTISSDGYALTFKLSEVRTSNAGAGTVRGMIVDDNIVVGASVLSGDGVIVSCTHNSIKVTNLEEVPARKRGAKGVILQRLSKDDEVISAFTSNEVVAWKNNKAIRLPEPTKRSTVGEERSGTGVTLGHRN